MSTSRSWSQSTSCCLTETTGVHLMGEVGDLLTTVMYCSVVVPSSRAVLKSKIHTPSKLSLTGRLNVLLDAP